MTLTWSYKRKGQKRTEYILTDDENSLIKKSDNGKDVPEWLHDYLAMGMYKEFDLHIGDQHSASFILDKKISAHRRAEILSLGKEASKVQRMITLHGEKVSFSKKERNRKLKELNEVKNKLAVMRKLGEKMSCMEDIASSFYDIQELSEDLGHIKIKAQVIKKLEGYHEILSRSQELSQIQTQTVDKQAEEIIGKLTRLISLEDKNKFLSLVGKLTTVDIIELNDISGIQSAEIKLSKLISREKVLSRSSEFNKLSFPNIEMIDGMMISGRQISALENKLKVLSQSSNLSPTEKVIDEKDSSSSLRDSGKRISDLLKKQSLLNDKLKMARTDKENSDDELEVYIDKIGGVCPTCNGEFSKNTHMEACQ
jgi:hypothetical protein